MASLSEAMGVTDRLSVRGFNFGERGERRIAKRLKRPLRELALLPKIRCVRLPEWKACPGLECGKSVAEEEAD
jgi:hypothetical protein